MGAIQSINTSQAIALVAVAGAVAYWYTQSNTPRPANVAPEKGAPQTTKKSKKKGASSGAPASQDTAGAITPLISRPVVVAFPTVVPGAFDPAGDDTASEPAPSKSGKGKKKKAAKGKKNVGAAVAELATPDSQSESSLGGEAVTAATIPALVSGPPSSSRSAAAQAPKVSPPRSEELWTRVETRRKKGSAISSTELKDNTLPAELSTSDAGVATSVTTGNSTPTTDKTEDEVAPTPNKRTLAEKLTPKPRKTGVEDMLETPDVPALARVMRVIPRADEQPIAGYNWGDYEDVNVSDVGGTEADGEDDGGWGVVKSKGRSRANRATSSTPSPAPEALTKKQRSNAAKREKAKAEKAEQEAQREAIKAQHLRGVRQAQMEEQLNKPSSSGTTPATGGSWRGMVWDS